MNNISSEYVNSYGGYDKFGAKRAGEKMQPPKPEYKDGDIVKLDISKDGLDALSGKQDANNVEERDAKKTSGPVSTEYKLSDKAKDFLQSLREKYGDYDFFVADTEEDMNGLLNTSRKEISVAFSSAELEKMANDEEYAAKKLEEMEGIIGKAKEMAEEISDNDEGINVKNITIKVNDDGTYNLFAELEKSSEKQRERIEKQREERAEAQKEQEKKTDEQERGPGMPPEPGRIFKPMEMQMNPFAPQPEPREMGVDKETSFEEMMRGKRPEDEMQRMNLDVKRTTVSATSFDELKDMISNINWDEI